MPKKIPVQHGAHPVRNDGRAQGPAAFGVIPPPGAVVVVSQGPATPNVVTVPVVAQPVPQVFIPVPPPAPVAVVVHATPPSVHFTPGPHLHSPIGRHHMHLSRTFLPSGGHHTHLSRTFLPSGGHHPHANRSHGAPRQHGQHGNAHIARRFLPN